MNTPSLMKLLKLGCEVKFPRGERLIGVPAAENIQLVYYETPKLFPMDKDGLERALFDVKVFELRGTVRLTEKPLIEKPLHTEGLEQTPDTTDGVSQGGTAST